MELVVKMAFFMVMDFWLSFMSISNIPIREPYADSIKGIAIIGVVCIHASGLLPESEGGG